MPQIFCTQYQALSSTGSPLPQARLHFFVTGTTTAAPVYADVTRTRTLPNPLIADAQGRFPEIYPDPDRVYRVRLTDSAGVQQWDDNGIVLPIFVRTRREIATEVMPLNYAYPPGDVRRYGADPTGANPSSKAFTDATRSTHPVYIPEGVFIVTGVQATGTVTWRGEGAKSVLRSDSIILRVVNGTGSLIDNLHLENITTPQIIARDPNNWSAVPTLKPANGAGQPPGPGYAPTSTDEDVWSRLSAEQRTALEKQSIGPMIQFDGSATNVTVSRVYGHFVVIHLKGCTKSVVRDCNFRAGKNFGGIFIDNTHTGLPFPTTGQNKVIDNIVEFCSGAGIIFMNNLDSEARGNTCSFNGGAGVKLAQGPGLSCARMLMANNTCVGNYHTGIDAAAREPLDKSQNLFHTIIGNVCINNHRAGMRFDGNFVNVVGNMNHLNQWEGIFGDAANSSIVGNMGAANGRAAGHNEILLGGRDNLCATNRIHVHESGGYGIWSIADNVVNSNYVTGGNVHLGEPSLNRASLNLDASGASGFAKSPLTLGSYRLWVDAGGRLRIKDGAPTSDADGIVVGAQT